MKYLLDYFFWSLKYVVICILINHVSDDIVIRWEVILAIPPPEGGIFIWKVFQTDVCLKKKKLLRCVDIL